MKKRSRIILAIVTALAIAASVTGLCLWPHSRLAQAAAFLSTIAFFAVGFLEGAARFKSAGKKGG
jgi:hypothetical protein